MTGSLSGQLVLVCRHVLDQKRAVELIVHHSDGMWSFMCGSSDHTSEEDVDVIHAEHIFETQQELERVALDLGPSHLAEKLGGAWRVTAHDD